MTTRRRLSTDELITELLMEIRNDRTVRSREFADLQLAVKELGDDFRAFRDHVLQHEDKAGRKLRMVADHAGVTEPTDRNGR